MAYLDAPPDAALRPIPSWPGKCSFACWYCSTDANLLPWSKLKIVKAQDNKSANKAMPRVEPTHGTRKTLKNRYPTAKATFGQEALEQRPECAIIIARSIAVWSYIDVEVGLLLSQILSIEREAAFAMFLSVKQSRVQNDMVRAAAESTLDAKDLILLSALFALKDSYQKERDDLAHGLFGVSIDVPNGVIWQQPYDSIKHTTTVWHTQYRNFSTDQKTFVYEISELENIASKFSWLCTSIGAFRGYLSSTDAAWRAQRYPQLCAEPRIATEIRRIREGEKNAPRSRR